MKKLYVLIIMLLLGKLLFSQDVTILIWKADSLEHALNEIGAYETFKQVLKKDGRNYYALWKCSELCSRIGHRQTSNSQRDDFYQAGKIYAEAAIKVNPAGADGYYVLSLAMGRMAQTASGDERIKAVKEIKANAEKAIQLNPGNGRAWHVLGKWNYEVSNLNIFERSAVKLFYGGLPKASLQEAIRCYEKARSLEPAFALNNLELAKAYVRDGQPQKAIQLLKELPFIPTKTEDDAAIREEGKTLLAKLEE
jgi:FimV-like protein